ncbi:MAG: ABC transporter ATP-binding protein [Elusimicrobiota bacterium]
MNIIELKGARKVYRKSHLGRVKETVGVADVSLEVRQGEVFGLVGLNGAGKSTTIKLILGLQHPTRGTAEVFGRQMPDVEVLRRIGYLPEATTLSRYLTGREAVSFFAALSGIRPQERESAVTGILEHVGMLGAAQDRCSEYSKGMLQRISMAQALVHDPELLILDEPGSGLDPLAIKELRDLIGWLRSRGKTVFFSSHHISELEQVCDRIGVLSEGRVARLIDQKEWREGGQGLEEIFLSAVRRSERVGPMRFQP